MTSSFPSIRISVLVNWNTRQKTRRNMFFQIDVNAPAPIYEQIYRQAKFLIANGALGPDELIPSVREVARALAINP